MNKVKRYFKNKRIVTAMTIALTIAGIYLFLILANIVFYHMDKQRCLNKSFNELKEDGSCDKYWRYNNEN